MLSKEAVAHVIHSWLLQAYAECFCAKVALTNCKLSLWGSLDNPGILASTLVKQAGWIPLYLAFSWLWFPSQQPGAVESREFGLPNHLLAAFKKAIKAKLFPALLFARCSLKRESQARICPILPLLQV